MSRVRSLLRPLGQPATYAGLGFLLTPLVLSGVWMGFLVTAWIVIGLFAITPLVVPILMAMGVAVRASAVAEAALARSLLGARIELPPRRQSKPGFWAKGGAVLSDRSFWRAQAYLVLRLTLGFGIALGLVVAVAVGFGLLFAPAWYWAPSNGIDVGIWHVNTLAKSLALVPVGALVLLGTAHLVRALAAGSRTLSNTLLGQPTTTRPLDAEQSARRRGVLVHGIVVGGVDLLLVIIWALTSSPTFWPIWAILATALALSIHAWVIWVLERPEVWTRRRLNTAFAIHAGVWVAFILFLVGVWAASSHGYFWPVWVMLPAAIAVGAHAAALLLRSPDREALTERISTLETSRAGAVDVQEAELRRIERDLHDGAQARLVALGMSIGMAEQKMGSDPEAAQALLAEARSGAGEALRELRDLARGIHPPVLADRGLHAAIQALAVASPITVTVSVDTPERPKAPVESAAYFVVAESLANAGKYARATQVDVRIARVGDALAVSVTDNGVGGADPSGGGLSGLSRRVEALDGTLTVTSPPGGPTTIRAELPCGS